MAFIETKQFKKLTDTGRRKVNIQYGEYEQTLYFTKVQVGYGMKTFFVCPRCGEHKTKLFFDKNHIFKCNKCCTVKLYNGIQNTTKGGDQYLEYKMERFANKVGIGQFQYPFDYLNHSCPKGKHNKKWNTNLRILQALENMRMQCIFFNKIWDSQIIQSVETGKNKHISLPLPDLKNRIIPFDSGINPT